VRGEARGAGAEAAGDEQMKRMNEDTHNCKKRLLNITFSRVAYTNSNSSSSLKLMLNFIHRLIK